VPHIIRRGRPSLFETTKVFASSLPLDKPLDFVQEVTPLQAQGFQVTKLENGLKVATIDNCSSVARIGLFLDAGSRYETPANLGISHFLRAGAYSSTTDRTAFRITREVEYNGATLDATTTREHLILSADCLRDRTKVIVDTLASVVCHPKFFPWEIENIVAQVKLENAIADTQPQVGVLETLHKLAYRNTLGNSLYCPPSKYGAFTSNVLLNHATDIFVGNRLALVGVGVSHEELVQQSMVALAALPAGTPAVKMPAKYSGGESHLETGGALAHAALVSEGVSFEHSDFAAFAVLQRLLGTVPYIKWGSNVATSRLNLALTEVTDGPYAVSSFSTSYTDSGLFGFYVVCEGQFMAPAMRSCVAVIRNVSKGNLADAELERAKCQTKAHLLMNAETQSALFEDLGVQVMSKADYTSVEQGCAAVDKVTGDDVAKVAQKVYKGKPTLSAAGNMGNPPHLDELF